VRFFSALGPVFEENGYFFQLQAIVFAPSGYFFQLQASLLSLPKPISITSLLPFRTSEAQKNHLLREDIGFVRFFSVQGPVFEENGYFFPAPSGSLFFCDKRSPLLLRSQ
jgi:hypothetical protein